MIKPPWVLDSFALANIAAVPEDQKQYARATFEHYYYNSYKVPCVATFFIWGLFLLLILAAGSSAFIEHVSPRVHHAAARRAIWWRANISEHPLVTEKHSQVVACGRGPLSWLTLHLPLRLDAAILVIMMSLNIVPLIAFHSLYVGHNTYFTGSDAISRRNQILRHLANRCAMLGIGQLPMLILLSSKRTPVAIMSQLSMNTMMLFHRWIARTCYCHIIVHTLCNALIFHFSIGFAQSLKMLAVRFGIVAIIMLSGLVFLSLRTLRKRYYEVFVFMHISMALLMIVFTYLHIKYLHQGRLGLQIFVIELTAAFWAFDRTVRLLGRVAMSLSWRYADGAGAMRKAELTSYANGAYTRMRIQVPASRLRLPSVRSSHQLTSCFDLEDDTKRGCSRLPKLLANDSVPEVARIGAGDDIRITVPRLQWVGEHPFSVFAVGRCKTGNPNMGYIDLIIQRQAGLTQKLSKLAEELSQPTKVAVSRSDESLHRAVRPKGNRVKVVIDGPFGKSPSLRGARHAVLIAGGVAITFSFPLLVKAARGEYPDLESCKLVWIVRNEGILDVLRESLPELLDEVRRSGGSPCRLSIDIYVTTQAKPSAASPSSMAMLDRRPSRLQPTWTSSSNSLAMHSTTSSVTLRFGAEKWSTDSTKVSTLASQNREGGNWKLSDEFNMPGLHSERHSPLPPAHLHDSVFNRRNGCSGRISASFREVDSLSPFPRSSYTMKRKSSERTLCSTASLQPAIASQDTKEDVPSTIRSAYSSRSDTNERFDHKESEEVLIQHQEQRDADDESKTPYSESISSSQYTGYRIEGINSASHGSRSEMQLQHARSRESCAGSDQSITQLHSPASADALDMLYNHQEELYRRLLSAQDVSAETRGGVIEIRRFRGRPTSMAAAHGHVTKDGAGAAGRLVFATCGPAPMCDSVRAEVVSLLKKGVDVALVEDCFNW